MLGAIIGDIIGSRYEFDNIHTKDFRLFGSGCRCTDDSVMTIAVAQAVMQWDYEGRPSYERLSDLAKSSMREWGRLYPHSGYGSHFSLWLADDTIGPYNSCGNGAAMRISPVGWAARTLQECVEMSRAVTRVSHNHPDGIKGAESTAVQLFLARQGMGIRELRKYELEHYYKLPDMDYLRKCYQWESCCDGTCDAAFVCLYESRSYEDAIRNCVSIGGDTDTLGAICGGIAEAYWGIPEKIAEIGMEYLYDDERDVLMEFSSRFVH